MLLENFQKRLREVKQESGFVVVVHDVTWDHVLLPFSRSPVEKGRSNFRSEFIASLICAVIIPKSRSVEQQI